MTWSFSASAAELSVGKELLTKKTWTDDELDAEAKRSLPGNLADGIEDGLMRSTIVVVLNHSCDHLWDMLTPRQPERVSRVFGTSLTIKELEPLDDGYSADVVEKWMGLEFDAGKTRWTYDEGDVKRRSLTIDGENEIRQTYRLIDVGNPAYCLFDMRQHARFPDWLPDWLVSRAVSQPIEEVVENIRVELRSETWPPGKAAPIHTPKGHRQRRAKAPADEVPAPTDTENKQ